MENKKLEQVEEKTKNEKLKKSIKDKIDKTNNDKDVLK